MFYYFFLFFPFPSTYFLYLFLIALTVTSFKLLNRHCDNGYPFLISNLIDKTFNILPLSEMLAVFFSYLP